MHDAGCRSKIPFLSGDTGCTMEDAGYKIHDAGCTMQDGGCRSKIPFLSGDTGCLILDA